MHGKEDEGTNEVGKKTKLVDSVPSVRMIGKGGRALGI